MSKEKVTTEANEEAVNSEVTPEVNEEKGKK